MQLWMESQHNWKTEVGVTTASVRHCGNSSSSSQVPHTCSPPTLQTTYQDLSASASQAHTSHHQACLNLSAFLGFLLYVLIHTEYISNCVYIYISKNTHIHTLHFYHNHLPSHPLQPVHLTRVAFSSLFPLKLKLPLQSFSLQNPHSLFGNWGRSGLPSEVPSHLHTTLVLPPSLSTPKTRPHWVPLNVLHNQQLNFSLDRAIRLRFTSCVTTGVRDTLETRRNLRRAEICSCV